MINQRNQNQRFEKAGEEGLDPRCVPIKLTDGAPEGRDIVYSRLFRGGAGNLENFICPAKRELLPGRACREYLSGLDLMDFPEDKIPYLGDVGDVLMEKTNWQVARVPGLLFEGDFFERLARRVFPSTDYIRSRSELDYTPAPDLFHDYFWAQRP